MKRLLKNRKEPLPQQPSIVSKGFQVIYSRTQDKWAGWMSRCTAHFSRKTWLLLLLLFVLCMGLSSTYLAIHSLIAKTSHPMQVTPIMRPKHITETGEATSGSSQIPDAEYNRIKRFRRYMDSLARSPGGQWMYDSITLHRPGLMDSVRFIENYYQQLKQK